MPEMPDGIHPRATRAVYDAQDRMNYSRLKHFHRSAMHARELMTVPPAPTPAMEVGTALHTLVLEPHRFDELYVVAPHRERRSKADKEWWAAFEAENRGREIVRHDKADKIDEVRGMAGAIARHPLAGPLLRAPGLREVMVLWTHGPTGVRCKSLQDLFGRYDGSNFVADIKTCQDASPAGFPKAVANYLYHVQAAYYLDGLGAINPAPVRFLWVAVESKRPHGVCVHEATPDALRVGRALYEQYLAEYAACRDKDEWPGYPTGAVPLKLPRWATPEEE